MATPSGQISLSDVNTELGLSPTAVITMNDAAVRTLAGVGGSGTVITMQDLQNKSNRVTANITISSNTANYTLNTAKVIGYSAGKTDATLTINPSIFVSSSSTGSYALQVDTSWNVSDTVTIVNNGTIIGRGGNGGKGSDDSGQGNAVPGSTGGPALLVQRAISLNNINRISGGGGGGGGSGFGFAPSGKTTLYYGGGGGGGGIGESSGGARGTANSGGPGTAGSPGTLTSAGSGGPNGNSSTSGGAGGTYGSSGAKGGIVPNQFGLTSGNGGAAGGCIVGNSNITYINTGTRNGSIS